MASSNYPFNQDTAFNSFNITDPNIVQATLGRTYAQSELVPVNYLRLFQKALTDASIKWFPLQEFIYISDAYVLADYQNESTAPVQSAELKLAFSQLFDYWKNFLILNSLPSWNIPLNSPMVVATPHVSKVEQDALGGSFHLVIRFNLVVFVVPNSIYA